MYKGTVELEIESPQRHGMDEMIPEETASRIRNQGLSLENLSDLEIAMPPISSRQNSPRGRISVGPLSNDY